MASWADLEAAEPEFAARVRARFASGKHCTMATLRLDGAPRISGTEVEFSDGDVLIGSMPDARKLADLRRDPRLALHSPSLDPPEGDPSEWAGDAKLAGVAHELPAGEVPAGEEGPPGHRFRIDLGEVVLTRVGTPADHLVIETWHPARGLERLTRR